MPKVGLLWRAEMGSARRRPRISHAVSLSKLQLMLGSSERNESGSGRLEGCERGAAACELEFVG
jgi:hypothetical protein